MVVVGSGALPPGEKFTDAAADRLFGMRVHVEALPSQTLEFTTQ